MKEEMPDGAPYKPVAVSLLSGLLLDYLHISFPSGAEFHFSNVIWGCPCQENPK